MDSRSNFLNSVRVLNMKDIVDTMPNGTFNYAAKRSRAKMEDVMWNLPLKQQQLLQQHTRHKEKLKEDARKKRRLEYDVEHLRDDTPVTERDNSNQFLQPVSEQCQSACISSFIDATGNRAVSTTVCAVCAGHFFHHEVVSAKLDDLQAKNKLSPASPHPRHHLTNDMLLHRNEKSLSTDTDNGACAIVCKTCVSYLNRDLTPPLSLANSLWIGDIPLELKILTLPERILIARFFPAAYIVKLYPKKKGAHMWAKKGLHCGLRGNVSTYRLNTNDVSSMVSGNIMPPMPSILASTIGVTFVGPKNLPEKTMPGFLHVNRDCVRHALEWLKMNNPIYENITISMERLAQLCYDPDSYCADLLFLFLLSFFRPIVPPLPCTCDACMTSSLYDRPHSTPVPQGCGMTQVEIV